ncbi:UvrD-helicase domain-containing protein [Candidatus Falkowbacteria bacterium]|jgi:DNA helicase-2/ATP-dependent DNA helicase PcrA|nr:UvrD-helicase domain-containing protein [Candidatus Falkowbacteria bacterium]
MKKILEKLNKEQRQAVTHEAGPLLIIAGAGTGKTTVLINRLTYLIMEKKVPADQILLLTFTEKAASEMEERADQILPYGYVDLWISTFHSFGERLLREHALDIGLNANFRLLTETDQWILIRKNLTRFNLDYYRPLGNPTKFISELIRHFSRLKDENITPAEYLKYAASLKKTADEGEEMEVARIKELAEAYQVYNQLLLENNYLDFGDLIVYTLKLFSERPNILQYYRQKFKYIMVDEFQDTNWAQYELVKILAAPKNNLVVVGDDDQCLPGDSLVLLNSGQSKKIKEIKKGDEVVTAVGKGAWSYGQVSQVNKIKKEALFLTFTTNSGKKVTVTDNHKLFCFVPRIADKKYFYVYLIFKPELGWRIGLTNDLASQLRLEKSADRIIAVRSFKTLAEAGYYKELLSLKYRIPVNYCRERDSLLNEKKWSEKLSRELKVEAGVRRLAQDLNLDLESAPCYAETANYGNKAKFKINLEMCSQKHNSKISKNNSLAKPKAFHCLRIETTDQITISKLKKMGFSIVSGAKKKSLFLQSDDLKYLGRIALRIQKEFAGLIEPQMKIAKAKEKVLQATVVPAKNVFPGMSVPIMSDSGIVYDQVVDRQEQTKKDFVYDLEIAGTHNFVADEIFVHNSIYKFRGASISNIMQFKDDFKKAAELVLTENYRSRQEILDYAHRFIQNNNPNRLEEKLKINKQLKAKGKIAKKPKTEPAVKFYNFETAEEETSFVAQRILDIYQRKQAAGEKISWSDFAILVRANDTADAYVKALGRYNIPNQFMSWRGLYYKPLILDILAYLRLLDNYHESSALFRVLNMDIFKVSHLDLVTINKKATRKVWSLYEALKNIDSISGVSTESIKNIKKLLNLITAHSALVAQQSTSKIFLTFVYESGLLADLDHDRDLELFSYLNQFYQKIKKMEEAEPDLHLKDFLAAINLELEAGETGSLKLDFVDNETVKIMTVHGSKGLEFQYVFLVNLVDKKFPTIARGEKIPLPDDLVKEKTVAGADFHLEEERRLFYVAVTRAKEELYLTGAKDYGGVREKKPSRFLSEMGIEDSLAPEIKLTQKNEFLRDLHYLNSQEASSQQLSTEEKYPLPDKFSFSQLTAVSTCPLQYKYAFVLKIPASTDKSNLIFGRVIHSTLYNFLLPTMSEWRKMQGDLFAELDGAKKKKEKQDKLSKLLTEKRLLEIYEELWQGDGYKNKAEREAYYKKGIEALKKFWQNYSANPPQEIIFLEKSFSFKIGGEIIKGTIDRVDKLPDGTLEIIDYKTGQTKSKLELKDKSQLILYQLFTEEFLGIKVSALTYYYVESGEKLTFTATAKDITKVQLWVKEKISLIKKQNFAPTPSSLCGFCDFNSICEFKQR